MARKKRQSEEWDVSHIEEKYRHKAYHDLKDSLDRWYKSNRYKNYKSKTFKVIISQEHKNMLEDISRLEWKLKVFYNDYPEYTI